MGTETMEEMIDWLKRRIGTGSVILHGRPRCGKGTQAKILADTLGGNAVSSGDLFRAAALDPELKASLDGGDVVETEAFLKIVLPQLGDPKYAGMPLILDAVGRKHGEEDETMSVMEANGHSVVAVINIVVSRDATRKRGRNDGELRADDDPAKHEHRLEEFRKHTRPVLDYYTDRGMLIAIPGDRPQHEVTESIIFQLYHHLRDRF